jgi:uncharacterized Zn finger protein
MKGIFMYRCNECDRPSETLFNDVMDIEGSAQVTCNNCGIVKVIQDIRGKFKVRLIRKEEKVWN